jgi:uncharacterized membrane protein
MNRYVFLLHRYLGIALGLVISVWCLSGIVMMYVQYPELTPADEAGVLEPLELRDCCVLPAQDDARPIEDLRIEMMAGSPVLRAVYSSGELQTVDLLTGELVGRLDAHAAAAVAQAYAEAVGIRDWEADGVIMRDQWTVYGSYDPHRPLYRFSGIDDARTQWYVSSMTGEIVQVTTAGERFWNWLGAVPHWLYPTLLRQHTMLWSQTVIWLTIIGTFLTVLGVYMGLRQYRARRNGRYSPYRGAALWHHYAGLFFGALMLTWLVSGFFSMNPWGALESRSFVVEEARQKGAEVSLNAETLERIAELPLYSLPRSAVRIRTHIIDDEQFFVAWDSDGQRYRPAEDLHRIGQFTQMALFDAAQRIRPNAQVEDAGWIDKPDAYYYSHHEERALPVYRIIYSDGERFYLDNLTGEIVYAVDASRRWYRWLHYALHRGDFAALFRSRPVWDMFMLPLMFGVSLSALTGTWMGFRRLVRWYARRRKFHVPGRAIDPSSLTMTES